MSAWAQEESDTDVGVRVVMLNHYATKMIDGAEVSIYKGVVWCQGPRVVFGRSTVSLCYC